MEPEALGDADGIATDTRTGPSTGLTAPTATLASRVRTVRVPVRRKAARGELPSTAHVLPCHGCATRAFSKEDGCDLRTLGPLLLSTEREPGGNATGSLLLPLGRNLP